MPVWKTKYSCVAKLKIINKTAEIVVIFLLVEMFSIFTTISLTNLKMKQILKKWDAIWKINIFESLEFNFFIN